SSLTRSLMAFATAAQSSDTHSSVFPFPRRTVADEDAPPPDRPPYREHFNRTIDDFISTKMKSSTSGAEPRTNSPRRRIHRRDENLAEKGRKMPNRMGPALVLHLLRTGRAWLVGSIF